LHEIELVVTLCYFLGAILDYLYEQWKNPIFSPKRAALA